MSFPPVVNIDPILFPVGSNLSSVSLVGDSSLQLHTTVEAAAASAEASKAEEGPRESPQTYPAFPASAIAIVVLVVVEQEVLAAAAAAAAQRRRYCCTVHTADYSSLYDDDNDEDYFEEGLSHPFFTLVHYKTTTALVYYHQDLDRKKGSAEEKPTSLSSNYIYSSVSDNWLWTISHNLLVEMMERKKRTRLSGTFV